PRHILNVHQAVTLTVGLKPFDDYLRGALSIHQLCSENQSGLTLQPWQSENWNDSVSMQFSNRFFTSKRNLHNGPTLSLPVNVDPFSISMCHQGQDCLHLQDNQVGYYERCIHHRGIAKISHINLSSIQLGHLVKLQVSYWMIRTGKDTLRLISKLVSICIIDRCVE
ncbi:uncharacterized protein LAESUDRAFT_605086, partial [Laetiporus sulphureus 93-53]